MVGARNQGKTFAERVDLVMGAAVEAAKHSEVVERSFEWLEKS